MSRSDLKDLGETLDTGQCAVIAVAAAAIADRVAESLKRAQKVDRKELEADPKEVQADVRRCRLGQLTNPFPVDVRHHDVPGNVERTTGHDSTAEMIKVIAVTAGASGGTVLITGARAS